MKKALQNSHDLKNRIDSSLLPLDRLDAFLLKRLFSRGILGEWNSRNQNQSVIVTGCFFTNALLPFSCPYFISCSEQVQLTESVQDVCPFSVFGGSYREHPNYSTQEEITVLNNLDQQSKEDNDNAAHYIQVGDIPLFVASEGKNRVSLYRKLNRPIVARVKRTLYPAPNKLELFQIRPFGLTGIRYIGNDSSFFNNLIKGQLINKKKETILPFKESIDILEAYGVKWGKPRFSMSALIIKKEFALFIQHQYYCR